MESIQFCTSHDSFITDYHAIIVSILTFEIIEAREQYVKVDGREMCLFLKILIQ